MAERESLIDVYNVTNLLSNVSRYLDHMYNCIVVFFSCCPYYAAREMKAEADIIFMPYNYLLDVKVGISIPKRALLKNNITCTCRSYV